MAIDKKMIVSVLRDMGVCTGDYIGLHSSVPSLGRVLVNAQKQGGCAAVSQAVQDVIDAFVDSVDCERGVLMVPTFSYCFVGSETNGAYDPLKSASRVGMLTGVFLQRCDSHRSLHPTHSVAAIGVDAEQVLNGHEKLAPIGIDSPFHRLEQADGLICFMGTDCKTLSLLHLAEVLAGVPYVDTFCYESLGWEPTALVACGSDEVQKVALKQIPGCSESFGKFDQLIRDEKIIRRGKIYQSEITLFKAREALGLAVEKLRQDPFWLMCPKGHCSICDVRWKAHS